MAAPLLSIDWDPEPFIIAAQYVKLGASLRDFHEPLKRAVEKVVAPSIAQNFDEEGRPHWQPLAADTINTRMNAGFGGGPILDREGALKSVASSSKIWTIGKDEASIQDLPQEVWYGKVHQGGASFSTGGRGGPLNALRRVAGLRAQGGGGGTGVIPERPFLMIQTKDVDEIEDVFVNWVRERVALAGFRPGIG
jgi:phage gpG-like protein